MAISKNELDNIAQLASIRIEEQNVAELSQRLTAILAMAEQLSAVNTDQVEPLSNPLEATQRLRTDCASETNRRDEFQEIAPKSENGLYLVPKVIE